MYLLIKYFSDIKHNMSHYDWGHFHISSNKSNNLNNPNNLYIH